MTAATPSAAGRAVVIGGGISGLLSARVLLDHFAEVLLVERDALPDAPGPRKGIPQARHVHQLLVGGLRILEQFFPGLSVDLAAHGAVPLNWSDDVALRVPSGWMRRFHSRLDTFACSRDLLEWLLRQRLLHYQNLRLLAHREVVGFLVDAGGERLIGVGVRSRGGQHTDGEETLRADLVVDASGRSSRAAEWLHELGFGAVEETVVNSFLGYASRIYARPPGFHNNWKTLAITSRAPDTRTGLISPIEGDRWFVTLAGYAHDYPPTDEDGFLEFARSLISPEIYEAICFATPLGPIAGYRRTENRIRHYERLPRWPAGLVVLGDAACSFNPVYGQGMSAAARAARLLDSRLRVRRGGVPFEQDMQRRLARLNQIPWDMSTGVDFQYETTEGTPPRSLPGMDVYMRRLFARATVDPVVAGVFNEVFHLLRPPSALFQPNVVARVLTWDGRIADPVPAPPLVFPERAGAIAND